MKLETLKQWSSEGTNDNGKTVERLSALGIPATELTPSVKLVVSALLEKLDDVSRDLTSTKESLAQIEQLVDVDYIAPIPNRRAFMRRLNWAVTMHDRYSYPFTVLYFDLNGFKQINDTYGHAAGDLAIRHIAHVLSSTLRESDFLARVGGDEFAVIMYHADEEAAKKRGLRIVEKLHRTPFLFQHKAITLSAAFGCHAIRSGDDAESALAAADMSMYVDKRRTRGQQQS